MLAFILPGASMSKPSSNINLPKSWPAIVRSSMLHVVALARYAAVYTRSWAADSDNTRVRLRAERDQLEQEAVRLREEIRIKDARMAALSAHRRPFYPPTQRIPGAWQVDEAGDGRLFVLFTEDLGPGGPYGGIVDIFDTDGHLLTPNHFIANAPGAGPLESPWGITQAPADFGQFRNDILIGNDEGPGYINAFDPETGAYLGHLTHPDGTPIAIPGLWYLTFGGGTPQTGLTKQLYFDAGPNLEHNLGQGLFGRIIAAGQGDGRGSSAASAAGLAGAGGTRPGAGAAP